MEPDFCSRGNILFCKIMWQHDRGTTPATVLQLQEFNGSDVCIKHMPVRSTELDRIFCPNLESRIGGYYWSDDITAPRNLEHIFNLKENTHSDLCESVSIARS